MRIIEIVGPGWGSVVFGLAKFFAVCAVLVVVGWLVLAAVLSLLMALAG